MTIIKKSSTTGPALHALVIGAGDYLNQTHLTSAPISAYEISLWLINQYSNPKCPLGSVRLLKSESENKKFNKIGNIDIPNFENIKKSIIEWRDEANSNSENMGLRCFEWVDPSSSGECKVACSLSR